MTMERREKMAGKPGAVPVLDANYVVGAPKEQKRQILLYRTM